MKFSKGDIVNSAPGYSKAVFAIVDIVPSRPKNPYTGTNLVTGKMFKLGDDTIGKKIGTLAPDYLAGGVTEARQNLNDGKFAAGQTRAKQEVMRAGWATHDTIPNAKERWAILAEAKPGDRLSIRSGGKVQEVRFQMVLAQGDKYVFGATNSNGTSYRYPLDAIIVTNAKPTAKRSEAEIIEDLQAVECGLSPENLCCDGEASSWQIARRSRELTAQRAALIAELGRTPTVEELNPDLAQLTGA